MLTEFFFFSPSAGDDFPCNKLMVSSVERLKEETGYVDHERAYVGDDVVVKPELKEASWAGDCCAKRY